MDTELFDQEKINNAVGDAFGTNPVASKISNSSTAPSKNAYNGPNLNGLDPNLASRVEAAKTAYKQKYGKELPITSGVRSRDEQQRLFDQARSGKAGIYMPLDPSKYPDRKTFHTDAVDISTSVPESFLNQYGIHRPLGKKDPVHAVLMPQQNNSQSMDQQSSVNNDSTDSFDLSKFESAVNDAYQNPGNPPHKTVAGKVDSFLRATGRGLASAADTLYSVVPAAAGTVTYAFSRPFMSADEANKVQQNVVNKTENPVGKLFDVTNTPEYKGEASRQLTEYIGENVSKGAKWIADKTGIPQPDVENVINQLMFASPALSKTKVGQAIGNTIKNEAGYVAEAVQNASSRFQGKLPSKPNVETIGIPENIRNNVQSPMETRITPSGGESPATSTSLNASPPSYANIGAMKTPDIATIREAISSATPELQQTLSKIPVNEANKGAIMRQLEADSLPVPIRLTEGQATGDISKLSLEQIRRGKNPELAKRFNEQNNQLIENISAIKDEAAPDVYATKKIENSQALIDTYKALDESKNVEIRKAYKNLEDANGGEFPINGKKLAQNAYNLLGKKLKTEFLPSSIKSQLNKFKNGEPMTFEQFEAMRTNLAAEIRKAERSGDGNAAMASSLVRQSLEDLPMEGEAATRLKPLADEARNLAKERFSALDNDPAYKAAVNDSVSPDNFLDKFVIRGKNKDIQTMINTFGRGSEAHQHMNSGIINWLKDKSGIIDENGNFSQAQYNKALKNLDDTKKLQAIFDPKTQNQLRILGNVARNVQFQPRGSFVNNSNTLVGSLAERAANALETGANVVGGGKIGLPLGSMVRQKIRNVKETKALEKSLELGAGTRLEPKTIKEMSKVRKYGKR